MLLGRVAATSLLALVLISPAAAGGEDAPSPLLEAVAYSQPEADPSEVSFIDWAQLKRLHGGEDVTSASPLPDRQRLMLEIARAEAMPFELGLDRLASWPDAWGWDNTDLEWEARDSIDRIVLRFGADWDASAFRDALQNFGYESSSVGKLEVWRPHEDARMPTALHLLGPGDPEPGQPDVTRPTAGVVIGRDGRSVVIHRFGDLVAAKRLARASRPDLERIADTPAVKAAVLLDRPLAASVAAGQEYLPCRIVTDQNRDMFDPGVADAAEHLHRYQARASGYT